MEHKYTDNNLNEQRANESLEQLHHYHKITISDWSKIASSSSRCFVIGAV